MNKPQDRVLAHTRGGSVRVSVATSYWSNHCTVITVPTRNASKKKTKKTNASVGVTRGYPALQLLTPRYCSTALARKCNGAVQVEGCTKTPAKYNASMQLWSWQANDFDNNASQAEARGYHALHVMVALGAAQCKAIQSGGPGVASHAYAIMCPQRRHAPALRGRGGSPPTPRHSQHTEGQGPGSRHATKPNSNT